MGLTSIIVCWCRVMSLNPSSSMWWSWWVVDIGLRSGICCADVCPRLLFSKGLKKHMHWPQAARNADLYYEATAGRNCCYLHLHPPSHTFPIPQPDCWNHPLVRSLNPCILSENATSSLLGLPKILISSA